MVRHYMLLLLAILTFQNIFSQVGIYTDTPNLLDIQQVYLDVNGRTIVRNLTQYEPKPDFLRPIGIDSNGVLGEIGYVPTDAAYYQSMNTDNYSDTEIQAFNSASETLVYWNSSTDLAFNDLLSFDSTDNSFTFIQDGQYEVGGFINIGILMPSSFSLTVGSYIGINATIQYSLKDNSSQWKDLSTCRKIFTGGALSNQEYRFITIAIPLVLQSFSVGDKLRVIVKKPIGSSVQSFQIAAPNGAIYSKALRVIVP